MSKIGLNSIRTSIAWTRLLPDGKNINPKAVTFYRDFFQKMLDEGVEPIVNLFHFDMPMWLMEKGGWESRESVSDFAFYAKVAFFMKKTYHIKHKYTYVYKKLSQFYIFSYIKLS